MDRNYEQEYTLITGNTSFGNYTTPEEQANNIRKCSILKKIDITFSDRVIENNVTQELLYPYRPQEV